MPVIQAKPSGLATSLDLFVRVSRPERKMDLDALEYTRQHYNKHSNQFQSTQEALAARKQGPGAPLKTLHNKIKRELINRCAGGATRDVVDWLGRLAMPGLPRPRLTATAGLPRAPIAC